MSFFENANVAAHEPSVNTLPTDIRTRIDEEQAPDTDQEPKIRNVSALPWWVQEKFFWGESSGGRMRLSPLPEFLKAVEDDAPKLVEYGATLLRPEGGSTEGGIVDALRNELPGALQSFAALDDREVRAFTRFLIDRATRNAVYAATCQFEIDTWVAKSAARGQAASENEHFGQKESRRDSFAVMAAVFAELVQDLLPTEKLTAEIYAKAARKIIYQQANHNTRDLLSPKDLQERENHAIQAAIVAARPI